MTLFNDKTREMIEASFRDAQFNNRQNVVESLDRALDYARNNMLPDVEAQLQRQYEARQASDTEILPATVPLVSFFVKEHARLYRGQVQRKLVHKKTKAEASEELQKKYDEFLAESEYNKAMTEILVRLVLYEETAVLPAVQEGKLDIRIVKAHDVWPLRDKMSTSNPAKASAYDKNGYVIDSRLQLDYSHEQARLFTLVKPEGMVVYEGSPDRVRGEAHSSVPNPVMWPQLDLDAAGRPKEELKRQPLQMLVPLHSYYATESLFSLHEPPIYTACRILNVQFSVLHDIFRWQAGPIPVIKLMDKDAGIGQRVIGVNRPLILQAEAEEAEFANSNVDFEMLTRFLLLYARITGLMLRMAPDDLAVEAQAPQSGFAKVIENLPKARAVEDMLPWLVLAEKQLYPRVAGIGVWLGKLPREIEDYDMEPEFSPPEIPKSVDERTKGELHDLKLGITTAGHILADISGLPIDVAEEKIRENREANAETMEAMGAGAQANQGQAQPGQGQGNPQGTDFKSLINGGRGTGGTSPQEPKGKGGPQPQAGQRTPGSRTDRGAR